MKQYGYFLAFAAMFLLFACDNDIKSKNDTAPQNDETAVSNDDQTDQSDQSDSADEDMIVTDDPLTDDAQSDDAQPDDAQPDDAPSDDTLPDGAQIDDTFPDDAQPDIIPTDNGMPDNDIIPTDDGIPDNDIAYPTTSSITYNKTVEPWSGGANILEGNAVIVTMPNEPPVVFSKPDHFVGSKSFIDVNIYRGEHSTEFIRVKLSRAQVEATELPVTILLEPPMMMKSLKTISQADWFDGELVFGFLTGTLTITGFSEGEAPGSPVILIFSGDDLTFTPTN